jgi:predicted RNase H-like HicB family nuclease
MKNFEVIVQQVNGVYRATVLALPQIKTEGASRDEALLRAQAAIEEFFKRAEVVRVPLYQQFLANLAADKLRQREEAQRDAE